MTSEHKVLLRGTAFVCPSCKEHHKYGSQRWHPAGICHRVSHTTLIIASGKGLWANRATVPEETTERCDSSAPYSCDNSCCIQLSGHAHDGFLLALHQEEGQQCCKDSLGISPTPLQGHNQGVLHRLVLLHHSSGVFLCLLPAGPNLASQLGCNLTSSLAAPLDKVGVFRVGNWNRGKTMCGVSTRLSWDKKGSSYPPETYLGDTGEAPGEVVRMLPAPSLCSFAPVVCKRPNQQRAETSTEISCFLKCSDALFLEIYFLFSLISITHSKRLLWTQN